MEVGVVREVYWSSSAGEKPAPNLIICFDYRVNFNVNDFYKENDVSVGRFVYSAGFAKDMVDWPSIAGIDVYEPPAFFDKKGLGVYYVCSGAGYGPPSLIGFFKDRNESGLSAADWQFVANYMPDSLQGLDATIHTVSSQVEFMRMIDMILRDGHVKLSPIFLRWGWFPKYIEFPGLELKINTENLVKARRFRPGVDCAQYEYDNKKCVPDWIKKETRE